MRLIRYISVILLFLSVNNSIAQSYTGEAYEYYITEDYGKAKVMIDSAIQSNEKFDTQTWQLRGFIYRNLKGDEELYNREIALESFVRANSLDTTGMYTNKIQEYLKSTLNDYFNEAVNLLFEEKAFEKSEISYETYKKKYQKLVDPNFNFDQTDIDYYNAVGSEYLIKIDLAEPSKKEALRELAIKNFGLVLELDSLDYQANYNSGIVYYNRGADIFTSKSEITIEELIDSQNKAEASFKKALPFLNRAEGLDPESMEVKEGLMGCHYGLHNQELYLKYQTIIDRYDLPLLLRRYETDPRDCENIKKLIRIYTFTLKDEKQKSRFERIKRDLNC